MLVTSDLDGPIWPDAHHRRTVVTIGAYDGLHLGHLQVIGRVKALAEDLGARSAVITFDRHPASVVRPESAPCLLTDADQRLELLTETGIDATVIVPFDSEQALESPESFVKRVIVHAAGARAVVVGDDFHFGRQRLGNVALLAELGRQHDFEVIPISLLGRQDGVDEPVSSTAIRRALAGGDVRLAADLLGRPFEVRGPVVRGDQRGRQIGFPTANVEVPNRICLPADGVYAGWYQRPDGSRHPAAINLGRRPTFYEHADHSMLEAHLIDVDIDLYGETARVGFVDFLRSERKFDGIEALVAQLNADVAQARSILRP